MRLVAAAGMLMLPLIASAAEDLCFFNDAAAPGPSTAYLLCAQGRIYVTRDAGAKWVTLKTGATQTLHAIAFRDASHGVVVGDAGTILATDDGGKTWREVLNKKQEHYSAQDLHCVYALGSQIWAGGFDGALLHSGDGGRTWGMQKSTTTMGIEGLYFVGASHGWAVGWSGAILRTLDGGRNWQSIRSSKAPWSISSVRFRDQKNGWAVGFAGELLRSRDGGATWEAQKSPVEANLTSLAFDKAGRIWIAADEQLLVNQDGGEKWTTVGVGEDLFLCKVFRVGDQLWALGQLVLLRQSAPGMEWKRVESLVPAGTYNLDSPQASVPVPATATGK